MHLRLRAVSNQVLDVVDEHILNLGIADPLVRTLARFAPRHADKVAVVWMVIAQEHHRPAAPRTLAQPGQDVRDQGGVPLAALVVLAPSFPPRLEKLPVVPVDYGWVVAVLGDGRHETDLAVHHLS